MPSPNPRIAAASALRIRPAAAVAQQGTPAAHRDWARAVALVRDGAWPEAARLLERAVKQSPQVALYWLNLASVRRKLKRAVPAMEAARRAFELDRSSITACHMLAELLRLNNRDAEALRTLRALPDEVPRDAQHWLLEGALLMSLRQWQEAAMAFLQVLSVKPAHIDAYMQLGFALANLKQHAESAECFRTVAILEPAQLGAAIYAAHYSAWACDWRQGPEDAQRMAQALALQAERAGEAPAFSPFCLLSMNDEAAQHLAAARLEAARVAANVRRLADWQAPAVGPLGHALAAEALDKGRCRIGFVSADFRTHATSMLLVRTLERFDRSRFEVVLYSHGPDDGSALRRRMEQAADRFVDCTEKNSMEQAEMIRNDGIAILVDMSGYTASTRLSVFALRPAPVQVLWLAYPSTIGGDFIDYVVGDPILTPIEHQADFSERIAQLPVCYEPTDERREHPEPLSRAECGLPEDAFVYACFNQSYKITEEVFSRWCRILQRVPGSVLWLLVPQENIQAALRERAAERGVDPERLIFAPFVSPVQHLARLPQADLFLDTFPYGAHTTCSDALWMGLPVLTQIGRSFSARVAASLLDAVGLPELVVNNDTDYEERAVALATLPGELACARDHLFDNRLDLPLFDNERFTHELEDLFGRMAARWRAGESPQAMPAGPPA
jgi:predicted O-linked N-acetylglucosamine transferase (SPINDLY family)